MILWHRDSLLYYSLNMQLGTSESTPVLYQQGCTRGCSSIMLWNASLPWTSSSSQKRTAPVKDRKKQDNHADVFLVECTSFCGQSSLTHSFSTGAYYLHSAYLDSCFDSSANLWIFPLFVDLNVSVIDEVYALYITHLWKLTEERVFPYLMIHGVSDRKRISASTEPFVAFQAIKWISILKKTSLSFLDKKSSIVPVFLTG